jgi:hypothetical protein
LPQTGRWSSCGRGGVSRSRWVRWSARACSPGARDRRFEHQVPLCDGFTAKVRDDGAGTAVLIADAPGTYTISVFLDRLDATDPTTADDTDTLTVTVRPAAPALAAGAVSIAPAHPRAGSTVDISFGLTDTTAGSAVASTAARCTTFFGKVRARVVSGRPTCTGEYSVCAAWRRPQGETDGYGSRQAVRSDIRRSSALTVCSGSSACVTERRQSRTDLPAGYAGVPVLKAARWLARSRMDTAIARSSGRVRATMRASPPPI